MYGGSVRLLETYSGGKTVAHNVLQEYIRHEHQVKVKK